MNASVVGIGYVGLATAALWAARFDVTAFDVIQGKVDAVNACMCPFEDSMISARLSELQDSGRPLRAELNGNGALADSDVVIVAVPTNFSEETKRFDTGIVEGVFEQIAAECPDAFVVLRSTVHLGTTHELATAYGLNRVLYCPEFLREGRSLEDCLKPDRVVIGCDDAATASSYCDWLEEVYRANSEPLPALVTCSIADAEAAKLFSNTYLAMRVAFFNELDSFAMHKNLHASQIIKAVCLDRRIGDYYNNPSFGYGGYCLPKDTKALYGCFTEEIPSDIVHGIVRENSTRKEDLVRAVLAQNPTTVGVYRLTAKMGSDNYRSSAMLDILDLLAEAGVRTVLYEPLIAADSFRGAQVASSIDELFAQCDIVLANRFADELAPYRDKVFTRDIFRRD